MFDKKHFIVHQYCYPFTSNESKENISALYSQSDPTSVFSEDESEYLIDGTSYINSIHPNSHYATEHLSYLQGFSLLQNKQYYFTQRMHLNSHLLSFTYEGAGILEYDGKTYVLSKGDAFWIDCRKPHSYRTNGSHWTHFDMHFDGHIPHKIFEELYVHKEYVFSQPVDGRFQRQLEDLVALYDEVLPCRELQISNGLESLLLFIFKESPSYQHALQKFPEEIRYLMRYIENNYMKPLSLDFLSDFSGISKSHLTRLFNQFVHCPPREYVIQVQLENAKRLLETTSLPASKIGIMIGIENDNYFRHLFKKRMGITPKQYRATVHKK